MEFKNVILTQYHFFFNLPGSCQMEGIVDLYNYICIYLVGILFFVSTLLFLVIKDHTDGSRHINQYLTESKEEFTLWMRFVKNWTHSTSLELIWTIIPTMILIAIAVPSFILLYALDEIVDCQCIVKIIGYQWYWKYEYPVNFTINDASEEEVVNVSLLSYMRPLEDLTEYSPLRLLEVDMPLVLPHSVNVKLIITAKDVLHSFAVPALGVKMDAVPGRLNQVTVFIFQPGVYYGQCSELCGVNHGYMPIVIHAISFDLYEEFLIKIAFLQQKEVLEQLFGNEVTEESLIEIQMREKFKNYLENLLSTISLIEPINNIDIALTETTSETTTISSSETTSETTFVEETTTTISSETTTSETTTSETILPEEETSE